MDTDYVAECLTVFHGTGAAIDRIRTDIMSGCYVVIVDVAI